jgi:cytosol alanyl aminopeptidase
LIVYKNQSLLAAPPDDTEGKARQIRSLQAHEVGHQWFGDLVTQASWTDVWLSEGFATWISSKMMDEEQPPARQHLAAVAARERIMQTDDSPRTRPVRLEMRSRDDTKNVYNQMVYQKGGALLLMLEGWLGADKVQTGLRAYLKKHEFSNATTADLESSLQQASGVDPAPVMDALLNHTGVPSIHGDCHDGVVSIEPRGVTPIPVCVRGDGVAQACGVIDASRHSIELHHTCPAWLYFNSGATGYYRTEWNPAQLSALDVQHLTAAERLTLVYDLRAEKTGADLLQKLSEDPEPEIRRAVAGDEPRRGKQ